MRPKVVILTLVAAFGLLAVIGVLKTATGKHADDSGAPATGSVANGNTPSTGTNDTGAQGVAGSSNPVVSDEMRAALVAREIDQIHELQSEIDGTNNPIIIQALIDKAKEPETEVRQAALEAVREIDDTNAIPGLQKLADGIPDARQKVAVLDVIDYLNLPDVLVGNPPVDTNDFKVSNIPPDRMNQAFMKEVLKRSRHKDGTASQQASVAGPPP